MVKFELEEYLKQMSCPCCSKVIYIPRLFELLEQLQKLIPLEILSSITSGYRCDKHNEDVGGVKNSYHTQGKAADIYIGGVSAKDEKVVSFVKAAREVGFKRIGYKQYKGVFVHLDVGDCPSPATW